MSATFEDLTVDDIDFLQSSHINDRPGAEIIIRKYNGEWYAIYGAQKLDGLKDVLGTYSVSAADEDRLELEHIDHIRPETLFEEYDLKPLSEAPAGFQKRMEEFVDWTLSLS